MLQAALAAMILMGIYKFMNSKSDYEVDWWMAFIFILAPGFLIFLASIGLAYFDQPPQYILAGYVLYFVIPFLMLKYGLYYKTRVAFKFSIVVPVIAVLTEIPFVILFGAANA